MTADLLNLIASRDASAERLSLTVITPALRWAAQQKKTPAPREEHSEGRG